MKPKNVPCLSAGRADVRDREPVGNVTVCSVRCDFSESRGSGGIQCACASSRAAPICRPPAALPLPARAGGLHRPQT